MILLVDTREPVSIKNCINFLNQDNKYNIRVQNLEIGDYIIYDEINDIKLIVIERKSLTDLDSSIKDGRYREQSLRLNNLDLHNHNIYYLIEGNIINYKVEKFKSSLYSSLVSISYYKGFSIYNSCNNIESAEIIYGFFNKLIKEGSKLAYYKNSTELHKDEPNLSQENVKLDYPSVLKNSKKSQITRDNIMQIMLNQIPGISCQTSKILSEKYTNIETLIDCLKNNSQEIDNIKLENNRKINKNVVQNLLTFLT
jgi:ERCC4-type nuclease|tara:strand:- start:3481 stop:4245 length:765 start_codon:yes stop_codon:yes gene_type:complete